MLLSVVAALGFTPLTATAQAQTAAPQASAQRGTGVAPAPIVRRLDTIPQMTGSEQHPQPLAPLTGVDAATFALRKARAAHSPANPKAVSPPPARRGSLQTPGAALLINSTSELVCNGGVHLRPADQAIAVGDTPVGILQAINVCLNVFSKSGTLQAGYPKSIQSFLGLPASTPLSDPRALYDWINHRYILVLIQFDGTQASASSYWIAVSTGDNPAGSYCLTNLPVQSVAPSGGFFPLPDYPRLGQDRQAIYLASNIFTTPTTYKWEEILVLPKAQLYASGCPALGSFPFFFDLTVGGVATDTTQPVDVFSAGDDPRSEYLVTSKNINFGGGQCTSGCNGLEVWTIHSPLSSPTLTGTFVATANNYSLPPDASQPGGANSVATGDTRISGMAMYNAGSIYASINAANGSNSAAILYQVQPFVDASGAIAGARLLNEIVKAGPFDIYYATQQPDTEGNVTYVWNFSGSAPGGFPALAFSSRRAGQSVGTEPDGGLVLAGGAAFYGEGRWGDYTAVAPGGLASGAGSGSIPVMYFAGMFARSDGTWGTAIGRNGYSDISQP